MENQQSDRPRTVTIAVNLLWASIAIGLVKIPLDLPALAAMPYPAIVWTVTTLVLGFFCLLIWKISQGRNWARYTYPVFFLIGPTPVIPTFNRENPVSRRSRKHGSRDPMP